MKVKFGRGACRVPEDTSSSQKLPSKNTMKLRRDVEVHRMTDDSAADVSRCHDHGASGLYRIAVGAVVYGILKGGSSSLWLCTCFRHHRRSASDDRGVLCSINAANDSNVLTL